MTLTFPTFGLANLMTLFRGPVASSRPAPTTDADTSRLDRDYMLDMMSRFPEAMQSESDVMLLMKLYSRHG